MTRRSRSRDWQDQSKRDQKRAMETFLRVYGRSESEKREPFSGAPRFACPECGTVDRRQHAMVPVWEYATTEGPRKAWYDEDVPPEGDGWILDDRDGAGDWERFDYHEERYWKRKIGELPCKLGAMAEMGKR